MTRKKHQRNNNKKQKEKQKVKKNQEWDVNPIARTLFDHVGEFQDVSNSCFNVFRHATLAFSEDDLLSLSNVNITTAINTGFFPLPMVALLRDKYDNCHIVHGIHKCDIPTSNSTWHGKWVGFFGNSFCNEYSEMKMLALRGEIVCNIDFHYVQEEVYTCLDKDHFGNLPLYRSTENDTNVFTTHIPKLFLMQPSWVHYFTNMSMDKYTVFKVLMKLAEDKKDKLPETILGYIQDYAKSLAHVTSNQVKLKTYEMDTHATEWKHKILHAFYGNPHLPTVKLDKKNIHIIESITKDEEEAYNRAMEKFNGDLYSNRIPPDSWENLQELLDNAGFRQYFTEEQELYNNLQYVRKENEDYMLLKFELDNKTITYETSLDEENKNSWLSCLKDDNDSYLLQFEYIEMQPEEVD